MLDDRLCASREGGIFKCCLGYLARGVMIFCALVITSFAIGFTADAASSTDVTTGEIIRAAVFSLLQSLTAGKFGRVTSLGKCISA